MAPLDTKKTQLQKVGFFSHRWWAPLSDKVAKTVPSNKSYQYGVLLYRGFYLPDIVRSSSTKDFYRGSFRHLKFLGYCWRLMSTADHCWGYSLVRQHRTERVFSFVQIGKPFEDLFTVPCETNWLFWVFIQNGLSQQGVARVKELPSPYPPFSR